MHLIFILPIVTIGLINGAKGDFDPVFALFPDGSTIKVCIDRDNPESNNKSISKVEES